MNILAEITVFICDTNAIATEEVHVVFVDNRCVIGDRAGYVSSVSCRLYETPLVTANELCITFIFRQFVETLQVQFIEGIKRTFANIKSTVDVEFPVE